MKQKRRESHHPSPRVETASADLSRFDPQGHRQRVESSGRIATFSSSVSFRKNGLSKKCIGRPEGSRCRFSPKHGRDAHYCISMNMVGWEGNEIFLYERRASLLGFCTHPSDSRENSWELLGPTAVGCVLLSSTLSGRLG